MKTTIVTTTVNVPTFLRQYAANIEWYGHDNVDIIVIGDRKTPEGARDLCKQLPNCSYLDIEQQKMVLQHKAQDLSGHLPENSIARRNIGHLMAWYRGADNIIMLDDDNFASGKVDIIKAHGVVGSSPQMTMFGSGDGWYNVCEALEEENGVEFYPRGYPPSKRWKKSYVYTDVTSKRVVVNGGLWVNDPDIDAITRLERRLLTSGMRVGWPEQFTLEPGTWSPWNCQNTSIHRDALPSYFLSPHTGRHLDIWASYITTRIAESQGDVISFGTPLSLHQRSPHNLYSDLEQEVPWIKLTDEFCDVLRSVPVPSTGYLDGLKAVIEGLQEKWNVDRFIKAQYLEGLSIWHDTFKELGAK